MSISKVVHSLHEISSIQWSEKEQWHTSHAVQSRFFEVKYIYSFLRAFQWYFQWITKLSDDATLNLKIHLLWITNLKSKFNQLIRKVFLYRLIISLNSFHRSELTDSTKFYFCLEDNVLQSILDLGVYILSLQSLLFTHWLPFILIFSAFVEDALFLHCQIFFQFISFPALDQTTAVTQIYVDETFIPC